MLRLLLDKKATVEKATVEGLPKNISNIVSYVSLGIHVIWIVLFIVVFMNHDDHTHERRLDTGNWWTFDETLNTLIIHAEIVKIGQPKPLHLHSKRLLTATDFPVTGTSKLVIHGAIESSSAKITSNILFHGLPIENYIQGPKGDTGEVGGVGSKGDTGEQGVSSNTGEGVWWTYDPNLNQLNLLTDVLDTGTIIASEFNIKD